MTERSRTSSRRTSKAMPRRTSSRASRDGRSPSSSREYRKTSRSGREASRASRSAWRGGSSAPTIRGTSGASSKGSSLQESLHSCLESRLTRRLGSEALVALGSTSWLATWGRPATLLGLRYSRLYMSERTTGGREYTLSPTPMASQQQRFYGLLEEATDLTSGTASGKKPRADEPDCRALGGFSVRLGTMPRRASRGRTRPPIGLRNGRQILLSPCATAGEQRSEEPSHFERRPWPIQKKRVQPESRTRLTKLLHGHRRATGSDFKEPTDLVKMVN